MSMEVAPTLTPVAPHCRRRVRMEFDLVMLTVNSTPHATSECNPSFAPSTRE